MLGADTEQTSPIRRDQLSSVAHDRTTQQSGEPSGSKTWGNDSTLRGRSPTLQPHGIVDHNAAGHEPVTQGVHSVHEISATHMLHATPQETTETSASDPKNGGKLNYFCLFIC